MPTPSAPAFPTVGGHPALDLVDTVHWRLDAARRIDTLADYADVVRWCRQLGLLDDDQVAGASAAAEQEPASAAGERDAVVALREAVYAAVFDDDPDAAALIAREHVAARARSELVRAPGERGWLWRPPAGLAAPRAVVAALAEDLVTSDLSLARQCGDDACGWVYLDTSPRGNRRWCTSAGCGNRNRVARHHARQRGGTAPGSAAAGDGTPGGRRRVP